MSDKAAKTGIILAAGLSQRFGASNKLLAPWRGRPLISHAFEAAAHSSLDEIILVTGQDADAIAALAPGERFSRVHNPDFQSGLASSLNAGLDTAPQGPVMVLLADMPFVSADLINDLLGAWREDAYALIPAHNGQVGNPVILGRMARADAKNLRGDRGARGLFAGRADIIIHPVSNPAILRDLDLASDFNADQT